jgi:hypothetical protein
VGDLGSQSRLYKSAQSQVSTKVVGVDTVPLHTNIIMQFSAPTQIHFSRLAPRVSPGISPESTRVVQGLLQEDYEKHHIYWIGGGRHK